MAVAVALAGLPLHAQSVPLLERITATVSPAWETTVRGAAGAVAPSSLVALMNLHTGHYTVVDADASGAFEGKLFAAGGSSILVKCDPGGGQLRDVKEGRRILTGELLDLGGTVLQVPDPIASSTSATASSLAFFLTLPPWVAELRLDKPAYVRGEPMVIDGTYTFLGSAAAGQTPQVRVQVSMVGISRADGRGTLDHNTYCSVVMTPTGLPIERGTSIASSVRIPHPDLDVPLQPAGDRLRATFRVTTDPLELPDGYYRPQVVMIATGVTTTSAAGQTGVATRIDSAARRIDNYTYGLLPVVKVGNPAPPRLYWTLLANNLSQGARGVTAVEDRDRFALANRIVTSSERFVVPRADSRTGVPIRYDLEPFALTIAVSDSGEAINWPTIPFRFPSGSLTVTIKRPGGGTTTIGPAPFRQPRLLWTLPNPARAFDSNHLADPYQLTTLDERFHVAFAEDGTHEVTVAGTIEDVWGHVYTSSGTYQIDAGRTLEIEPAVLPGTPFETGDAINPSVQLIPGVAADIEVRYRFAPESRRELLTARTLRAKASVHGYAAFEPIVVPQAGEYRMDFAATWRDERGTVWTGSRTWGGVVAQRSPAIELHGVRGVDDQQSGRQAWFSRAQIGLPKDTGGHVNLAFHSGDVMWLADNGDAATLRMGIQDPLRLVPDELLQRDCGPIEDRIVIGEAPFHTTGPDRVDPHIAATTDNELSAYAYRFVQRPRVRVREVIAEECVQDLYWRFDDRYGLQTGTGANGDLPNDFKFQFGGIALYGRVLPQPIHAIYGSLFVVIAGNDPRGTRVFPPFQGNGGLPSGGPLFRLKNRDVDIFFHPTAVRPGTILEAGTVASFAGQIGPALPSKVEIVVTSPGGAVRTISGQANKIGWFYRPSDDFIVNEPGVWRARVRVWHDGAISTGARVTEPFPTGGALGSRDGEFYFYVVDPNAARLRLDAPGRFVQPARQPLPFVVIPPAGLTGVEVHYTTTMPGFVLEEGTLSGFVYTYDAKKLAADFPNLDLEDIDGATGADTITMSFLLSGNDASGAQRHFARQIVLQGEEILVTDTEPRRRSVRH